MKKNALVHKTIPSDCKLAGRVRRVSAQKVAFAE